MTTVGIISDTHGALSMQALMAVSDCDEIIHAGDICGKEILEELRTIGPVHAVLGNNDGFLEYGEEVQRYARPVIDGVRFLVAHYPNEVEFSFAGSAALAPGDPIPHVCVHGHTHTPRVESGASARPAQYVICPGSVSRPRFGYPPSIARVEVSEGAVLSVRIEDLHGNEIAV